MTPKPTISALQEELEKLRRENALLRSPNSKEARPRVRWTERGDMIAVLVDGRRWAVTLEPQQWMQLLTDKKRIAEIKRLHDEWAKSPEGKKFYSDAKVVEEK